MTYIYILEDFAYSDFEYWVFMHEKHYTKAEFKQIVKEAMSKIPKRSFMWHDNLFDVLKKEYGFKDAVIVPIVHIDDLQRELMKEKEK